MSEQRPLKVLVSAFAFSPIKASEFSVGWDYVRAISSRHEVWVIARLLCYNQTRMHSKLDYANPVEF
jgi:hypothetical protein